MSRNTNEFNMDLRFNPVLDKNLYSGDGSLLTPNGDPYIPGNYLWDRYDGEYHTHHNGEICAGPHDREMMIDPERILSVGGRVLKYDSKIIITKIKTKNIRVIIIFSSKKSARKYFIII